MSFATYFMQFIFAGIPSLFNSDIVLYVLPALTIVILISSLKIMFYKAPKLRRVR